MLPPLAETSPAPCRDSPATQTTLQFDAQIIGHGASELIAEVVAHRVYGGSAEDLGRTIHAHLLKNSKA
jgi:hypothetical protein